MNKFENITVLQIDNSDYINGHLLPPVAREADTADIVIRDRVIVKNRLTGTSEPMTEANLQRNNYEGLCLAPDSFANNIHDLLCAVVVLQMSDNDAIKRTGDEVLEFARCYAEAAAKKELSS
ncbi:hypothetical protein ACSOPA_004413 [Escherichia coli]|uniref:hypothetical protein n=1 Tax=Escherichia coli TaxID=562 RepID=UPI0026AAA15D